MRNETQHFQGFVGFYFVQPNLQIFRANTPCDRSIIAISTTGYALPTLQVAIALWHI
ncbi:hypothetical protein LC613_26885 [Nostoc sphaeroides CHAB 2801]|uniref:hypothetical protein n=1 Tax=Nostoc sphaeroides TaxID=446679 RepID=UPI001E5603D0|nr:hypothetical protein [Nostoc sphaeroides]MCC5631385.1 hypothetical protein [Nostoc sphaeroides CHAB 2801]